MYASAKRDAAFVSGSSNCNTGTREVPTDTSCSNQNLMDDYFHQSEWEGLRNRISTQRLLKVEWHAPDIEVNIIAFSRPGYLNKQHIPEKNGAKSSTTTPASCCKNLFLKISVSHGGLLAKGNSYCPAK